MGPADLPQFVVAAVHSSCCTGRFDLSPWVGEEWIAGLYVGGGRFIWGRFRDIDMAARTCSFYPDQGAELSALCPAVAAAFLSAERGVGMAPAVTPKRKGFVAGRFLSLVHSIGRYMITLPGRKNAAADPQEGQSSIQSRVPRPAMDYPGEPRER